MRQNWISFSLFFYHQFSSKFRMSSYVHRSNSPHKLKRTKVQWASFHPTTRPNVSLHPGTRESMSANQPYGGHGTWPVESTVVCRRETVPVGYVMGEPEPKWHSLRNLQQRLVTSYSQQLPWLYDTLHTKWQYLWQVRHLGTLVSAS